MPLSSDNADITYCVCSDSRVHRHDELEAVLDADEQLLAVIDVNVEFALDGVVDEHAGLNANFVILRVPVRLVGDGHTVPSVVVHVAKSLSDAPDNSLGQNMGLHD